MGYLPYQLVQDFFRQQYLPITFTYIGSCQDTVIVDHEGCYSNAPTEILMIIFPKNQPGSQVTGDDWRSKTSKLPMIPRDYELQMCSQQSGRLPVKVINPVHHVQGHL